MATNAEIAVLEALAAQSESLEWNTGASTPLPRSRLRLVDRKRRLLLLDRCPDEAANAALYALARAAFRIEWGEWRIAFVAGNPAPCTHDGIAAIRLDLPDTVEISRRRMSERTPDPRPPLRCVARVGDAVVFDAEVTDVSQGGIGLAIEFASDELEPGIVLAGYRLECIGREPGIVDLEVRYATISPLPHGDRVVRIGCRFVRLSPEAIALVAEHVEIRPST